MNSGKMAKTKESSFNPAVDMVLCKECGYCREVCPQGVFEVSGARNSSGYEYMKAKYGEKCVGCLKCLMICPDFAITVELQPEK